MIAFCMCMSVDVDADSSPVVAARVKALIERIIQDSKGVLTHPSNTQGVTGWEGGGQRCEIESKIFFGVTRQPSVLQDTIKA